MHRDRVPQCEGIVPLIRGLWQRSVSNVTLYTHFYRPFGFDATSSWIQPRSFIDDLSESGIAGLPRGTGSVEDFRHYMPTVSDSQFAKIFGQQALEYWIYKKAPKCDFVGCSTYRRYLLIAGASTTPHSRLTVKPTAEIFAELGSDQHRNAALYYFRSADVITNRAHAIDATIERQYLGSQPVSYWNLMMEAIDTLFPAYRPHMLWFRDYNCVNFETTYIMRRSLFNKYAKELFSMLEFVFKNSPVVVPADIVGKKRQPCRYPGYLGERFFPFFLYANSVRKIEVPLVFVND